jgi:xanthine dehydrogenase molybdopterin-binding subunit B
VPQALVTCETRRMGGAFGGTQQVTRANCASTAMTTCRSPASVMTCAQIGR